MFVGNFRGNDENPHRFGCLQANLPYSGLPLTKHDSTQRGTQRSGPLGVCNALINMFEQYVAYFVPQLKMREQGNEWMVLQTEIKDLKLTNKALRNDLQISEVGFHVRFKGGRERLVLLVYCTHLPLV